MPLLNSFVDSFVCAGFSSERGLTPDNESKANGALFTSYLQPSLLAIVTADRAMYPQSQDSQFIDASYPPAANRFSSQLSVSQSDSSGRSSPLSVISTSLRTSKQHIIPPALHNLPMFCFPDGVRATFQREAEKIHHIVFTQEEGRRSYALVLTFQQCFMLKTNKQDDDGLYQIADVKSFETNARRPSLSKIPVPIEKPKPVTPSPAPTLSPTPPVKMRSRKMPSSFHYGDTNSTSQSRSQTPDNTTKQSQHHYATPTVSSYLKNLSPTATPPPTRMVRTNSQTNIFSLADNGSSTTEVRKRSSSNTSHKVPLSTSPSTETPPDIMKPFFLPHCIILVSNQPYWTAMQETISMIHDEMVQAKIEPYSNGYKRLIQKYALLACNTPVPPIPWERFSLSFKLNHDQSVLTFDPPINAKRTVLDLDLSILLLTLNIGKLLDVLAAIFTQRPIVFFSSNYSKLVTTLECLLYVIYPLKWVHVYVPLVPDGLRDYYLEGPPGSYIMGAHARHQSIVDELDISFTCNIDNDKNIHVPKNIDFYRVPPSKLVRFIGPITQCLEDIKVARSLQNVHTTVRLRIDQQREFERQHRLETNQRILKIFLNLMVDLCGDALEPIYWTVSHQQTSPTNTLTRVPNIDGKNVSSTAHTSTTIFSRGKYLLSKTKGIELEFYQMFVESTAFQILIDEEMKSTSPTLFRQICQVHLSSNKDQLYHFNNSPSEPIDENEDDLTAMLCNSNSSQMLLPLPDWLSATPVHYLDSCIELFTVELQHAQQERSLAVIAVYAYLLGCALLARGNYVDGLRDLYLIENADLFPRDYIETVIVPHLSEENLLNLFIHEPYYKNAPEWKKVNVRPTSQQMSIIEFENSGSSLDEATPVKPTVESLLNSEWNVMENALTYQQFSDHVHRLSIVLDNETTETLFNALLHWTDSSITKTLKKDKTLTNSPQKSSETAKSTTARRGSSTSFSLTDTLKMLNDQRRGNSNATLSPRSSVPTTTSLPATLFESFLDNWQQTNAEKVRMTRCLPEDRQKQESILKVSSSDVVSKKDGPGQLILTQKRLYFLPETRTLVRLLTELINIVIIDKYQHQTVFASSKPGIKIYVSSSANSSSLPRDTATTLKSKSSSLEQESKSSISLLFKNNREQELWHTMITELWSGLTIAQEQCDTTVLNKASRHIALMDALSTIEFNEETGSPVGRLGTFSRDKSKQRHNEASIEMALKDLSTFTRIHQSGSFKALSVETRNVLTRRLSPSINETERHAVRCLVFTEHPDNGRSSLWCAYGSKLKVFNVTTWMCDPNDMSFPSTITCLCLDARYKLWVGCLDGQLFVVDTVTRVCGAPLASIRGEGGCQTMAFDPVRNYILTGNQTGSVTLWNASNWERVNDINLCEIYRTTRTIRDRTFKSDTMVMLRNASGPATTGKNQNRRQIINTTSNEALHPLDIPPNIPLSNGPTEVVPSPNDKLERLQIYEDLLFACYRNDYILILRIADSNTYKYEHLIPVKYKTGDSTPIDSFLVYNKQLWISTGCIIYIFNVNNTHDENSYNLLMKKPVDDDHLITMLGFSGHIWVGSLRGNVYVFRMDNYELDKTFAGHHDSVCCLCSILNMYVLSGSAQNDTSIAIWDNVQMNQAATIASAVSASPASTPTDPTKRFSVHGTANSPRTRKQTDTKGDAT